MFVHGKPLQSNGQTLQLIGHIVIYEEFELCCKYGAWVYIHNTSSSSALLMDKRSQCPVHGKPFQSSVMCNTTLFGPFVSYEENEVCCEYNPWVYIRVTLFSS